MCSITGTGSLEAVHTDAHEDDADGRAHGRIVFHQQRAVPRQQAVAAGRKPRSTASSAARARRAGAGTRRNPGRIGRAARCCGSPGT